MTSNPMDDRDLLLDMLNTEKYISMGYNVGILDSCDDELRQALAQINSEEQRHAKQIFDAMHQRGWYPLDALTPFTLDDAGRVPFEPE